MTPATRPAAAGADVVRLPLTPLSDNCRERVANAMQQAGINV